MNQTVSAPAAGASLRWLPAVLFAGFLAACTTVGPDYRAPELPVAQGPWSQPADTSAPASLTRWWTAMDDPVLERLIELALAQNLDLRQAAARIDEARAQRDRVAGQALPAVGAGTSVHRRRQSENGPLPIGSIPGLDATQTIYDAGFDAAWEADLFGGQRRALESASARLEMSEVEAQGVRARVAAEVARMWFEASGASRELLAQQATVRSLQQTLELVRQRHALGDIAAADVDRAEAQLAGAAAALPGVEARQRAALLALGVLLASSPEAELDLLDVLPEAPRLQDLPVGLRAEVLRRRPDVLVAERRLAASTAEIGVATAELFPRLAVSAGAGFQALDAGDWLQASSSRFGLLPFLSWRLFDGGRVRAEIRAREAIAEQAALAYEQAVLVALADAERALGDYAAGLESLARRNAALQATRRSHAHAQARYGVGDIALTDLLATERLLHEARQAQAREQSNAAIRLVALYKALGGGWDAPGEDQLGRDPAQS